MTHNEYTLKLVSLRKEYADSIRKIATMEDDYNVIVHSEIEAGEYHNRVHALINQYQYERS